MIGVGRGQVERADAVAQDSHAFALEAAEDRPRGGGPKARCGNAWLAGERLPDTRPHFMLEQFLVHDGDAAQDIPGRPLHPSDDNRLIGIGMSGRRVTPSGGSDGIAAPTGIIARLNDCWLVGRRCLLRRDRSNGD